MRPIRTDLGEMAETVAAFKEIHAHLSAMLDQLDKELEASLGRWSGDAKIAYHRAHAEWRAAADDMAGQLAWLGQVLHTAHGNYSSALTAVIGTWGGN